LVTLKRYDNISADAKDAEIEEYIKIAQSETEKAIVSSDDLFGCVSVNKDDKTIAKAYSIINSACGSIAHAEVNLLIKTVKKLRAVKLYSVKVFINSEPRSMCASVMVSLGLSKFIVVYPKRKIDCCTYLVDIIKMSDKI